MNIFDELKTDHDKQRALLDNLSDTQGDEAERRTQFNVLKAQLQAHATAEERYFYSPLINNDSTVDLSRHGIAEHHEIDELIETIEQTDMSSPAWLQHLKSLKHKVLHHLEDEEQGFFQQAGKVLSTQQKSELGSDYRLEMDQQGI
ncbi:MULTISPECIES: hemerythrin domain-containing protein [Idiomarina]|jgi:hemerythrin superfamily protein|uniref:Hemerythrin domain-containing protein n=2 Tax=Idiomarina baltica TaxID=190892 RepID=A0A348WMJ4_9GAMM|nr:MULTISPECIES: hemerythrin domain-containing protein [Idiomarina]MAD53419.1 hemerythrin [Idiomarinaceae bacterium]MEC8925961.1 hemerythrin domain-containing protein [Pseudomonadota bacterium]EAQ31011.1 hypothetical protein OS145_05875 [Idiomarina baltica OS145]KXS35008.1 MAG: hypothetical protein AWU56_1423 [Idiomarina sp. T82-3]MAF76295.1 hemerythrin [Idiomarinaceae bacterium]|tara:strand:+ start:1113 stop:1550 length:438 start_codon:yes stop_codon:yes gene_type:complete